MLAPCLSEALELDPGLDLAPHPPGEAATGPQPRPAPHRAGGWQSGVTPKRNSWWSQASRLLSCWICLLPPHPPYPPAAPLCLPSLSLCKLFSLYILSLSFKACVPLQLASYYKRSQRETEEKHTHTSSKESQPNAHFRAFSLLGGNKLHRN